MASESDSMEFHPLPDMTAYELAQVLQFKMICPLSQIEGLSPEVQRHFRPWPKDIAPCNCNGGPQWGHAWDCIALP